MKILQVDGDFIHFQAEFAGKKFRSCKHYVQKSMKW